MAVVSGAGLGGDDQTSPIDTPTEPTTQQNSWLTIPKFKNWKEIAIKFKTEKKRLERENKKLRNALNSMDREKSFSKRSIPKIIHQSWKNEHLPAKFEEWASSWKQQNPEYQYTLWTDAQNRNLVVNHFPWFLETYDTLPKPISKADAVRYMYLYKYGGVYADLDVEALKPIDELLDFVLVTLNDGDWNTRAMAESKLNVNVPKGLVVVDAAHVKELNSSLARVLKSKKGGKVELPELLLPLMTDHYHFEHNIPNAWMASRPGHSFWMHCLHLIAKRVADWKAESDMKVGKDGKPKYSVEELTGPVVLFDAWKSYLEHVPLSDREPIHLLEPGVIFPYSWNNPPMPIYNICSAARKTFDSRACKAAHNATGLPHQKGFAISYWSHSWGGKKNHVIEQHSKED
ncbi:hypothetical protein HK098_006853 [Nowakowskiella sp. JEL0407]|nr:hypothetical protein HK098_006853 [Nowakowskiella sp. JEL0407]